MEDSTVSTQELPECGSVEACGAIPPSPDVDTHTTKCEADSTTEGKPTQFIDSVLGLMVNDKHECFISKYHRLVCEERALECGQKHTGAFKSAFRAHYYTCMDSWVEGWMKMYPNLATYFDCQMLEISLNEQLDLMLTVITRLNLMTEEKTNVEWLIFFVRSMRNACTEYLRGTWDIKFELLTGHGMKPGFSGAGAGFFCMSKWTEINQSRGQNTMGKANWIAQWVQEIDAIPARQDPKWSNLADKEKVELMQIMARFIQHDFHFKILE